MLRLSLLAMICASAVIGPALAAGPVDRVLNDLSRLGYGNISIERTLLGRTRIIASNDEADREIILDSRTGEILRDLWTPKVSGADGGSLVGGDEDDDDDDDGGNSGHGGGDDDGDDGGDDDHGGGDDGGGDDGGGDDGGGDDGED